LVELVCCLPIFLWCPFIFNQDNLWLGLAIGGGDDDDDDDDDVDDQQVTWSENIIYCLSMKVNVGTKI